MEVSATYCDKGPRQENQSDNCENVHRRSLLLRLLRDVFHLDGRLPRTVSENAADLNASVLKDAVELLQPDRMSHRFSVSRGVPLGQSAQQLYLQVLCPLSRA